MVAKIGKGENLMGALSYNQLKVDQENGQILYTHKIKNTLTGTYTASHLYRSFEPYLLANHKTEKPVLHISLNPDPKDKLNDKQYSSIAKDYMQEMGYGNQPFVVFKHTDIERTHMHIVSINVGIDGKKISDKYDHLHSMDVCRTLEERYKLAPVNENGHEVDKNFFRPIDYKSGNVKSQIAAVVRYLPKYYRFHNLGTYNALLSLFHITAQEVSGELQGQKKRGLVYFALNEQDQKASNPFKASLFGKSAGYDALEQHFEKSMDSLKKEPVAAVLKNVIETAMHTAIDELSFKRQLSEQGINTVVRRNNEARIYGITFIDHTSKSVWNGSQLSKNLSANVFNDWWNTTKSLERTTENAFNSVGEIKVKEMTNELHPLFDFVSKETPIYANDKDNLIEAFGGLLIPEAQGEDFQAQAFANRMKKKRKRRKG